jgi:hypothetical protein
LAIFYLNRKNCFEIKIYDFFIFFSIYFCQSLQGSQLVNLPVSQLVNLPVSQLVNLPANLQDNQLVSHQDNPHHSLPLNQPTQLVNLQLNLQTPLANHQVNPLSNPDKRSLMP